jgi:hypothetical protein
MLYVIKQQTNMKDTHCPTKIFYFYLNYRIIVIPYGIIALLYSDHCPKIPRSFCHARAI